MGQRFRFGLADTRHPSDPERTSTSLVLQFGDRVWHERFEGSDGTVLLTAVSTEGERLWALARPRSNGKHAERFVRSSTARAWMVEHGYGDQVDQYFPRRGRPTTGVRVEVRIPEETLKAVDRMAADQGVKRADVLRTLVVDAVEAAGR